MPLTEQQTQEYLSEALDSQKVTLYCKAHTYFGPSKSGNQTVKPAMNCPQCWMVFYFHDIASAAPHLREARLMELDEVLHKIVEEIEKGTWDYKPYRHAEMTIESN